MKPIRATPTPPTDKIVASVKSPRSHYSATVDDHIAKTSTRTPETGAAPEQTSKATPELHSALHEIGTSLIQGGDQPASMASIGFAFRHAASMVKPKAPDIGPSPAPKSEVAPEIGADTSGLFGTPSPERA